MQESKALLESSTLFTSALASAERLRTQFIDAGITINKESNLAKLIEEAMGFAKDPLSKTGNEELLVRAMLRGQHVDRVARAANILKDHIESKKHLWALKKDSLDPGNRRPSRAKDKLWELELLNTLTELGLHAELLEPDIRVGLPSGRLLSIACKRIYSTANAESQLSNGAKQIERAGIPGLLAVCIDDLLPPYCIVEAKDPENAAGFLHNQNIVFLEKNRSKLEKYVEQGRICGVLTSSSAPIRHPPLVGEIALSRQMTIWTTPNCHDLELVEEFRKAFFTPSETWQLFSE